MIAMIHRVFLYLTKVLNPILNEKEDLAIKMEKEKILSILLVLAMITLAFLHFSNAAPEEITLSQYSGTVGTKVTIHGTGFAVNSTVNILWDFSNLLNTTETDSTGNFTTTFYVPEATNGEHTVTALDEKGNIASTTFTVVASITLTPNRGVVDSTFDINGTGFSRNSWVRIYWDSDYVDQVRTDNVGTFILNDVNVPESTYGKHTVTAIDSNLNIASAIFFVEPNIQIHPNSAYVKTSVTVTCTGYSSNSVIRVIWDPGQPTETTVLGGITSDTGSFTGNFKVPEAVNGNHFVTGLDSNAVTATTTFTVVAHLILEPSSGYVNEIVNVYGNGFSSVSNVTLKWDTSLLATTPQTVQTNTKGSFNASFQTPQAVVGAHTVEATDTYGVSASASFSITPHIILTPDNGSAGSSSIVTCTGFSSNANIDVIWDPGLPTQQTLLTGATNSTGTYIASVTIPSASNGTHVVKAIDENGNTATTLFWVGPKISLVPNSGYVGTQTTVYGSNFDANMTVTITWDNQTIGTTTTNTNGSFTYTFTIPSAINGVHQVTAFDEANNTAHAYYVIYANITVSSTSGNVYDTITIAGTGFTNNTIVTVYWDGTPTQRSEISNAEGDVTLTFIIPESPQGTHEIQCVDGDGNPSNTIQFTINPKIELSTNHGYVGDTITISGTGFAADSLVTVTWDNVSQYATETSNSKGSVYLSYSIPSSSTGLHTLSAYDESLNKADGKNFTVLAPEKPVPLTPLNGTSTNINKPTFSWASTAGATTYDIQYSQDKTFSSGVMNVTGILETQYTLTEPLSDGIWYWRVQALDAHLNPSGYSNAFMVVIDTVPPTSTLTTSQYQTSLTFNIAYESSDDLSGVAYIELYFNYNGGNFEKYDTYFLQNGTISFYAPYGDGEYSFYTIAVDNAGNIQENIGQTQTIVDTTPPTSNVTPLLPYIGQRTFNLTYVANDDGSGVSYVILYYSVDGGKTWMRYGEFNKSPITFTAQSDGRYIFSTIAVDNAGNVQNTQETQVGTIVDATLPVTSQEVEGTLGNEGWYTSSVTITLTSVDATSGVKTTYFSVDNGSWQVYSSPFNITADGIHVIHYYTVDNAGNTETENTLTVKIDKTAPHTTSDAKETWYSQSPITINLLASDNNSGIAATYYRIDGTVWIESNTVTLTGDGAHTLEFYSIDTAGNVETVEKIRVRIDGTAPTVWPQQIIEDNTHIAGTYKFEFTTEDEAGISNVLVYIDGEQIQKLYVNPQTGFYEFLLNTTTLQDGEHEIVFNITDKGGHTVTLHRIFIVDNTPPLIDSITPNFSAVQSGNVNIEVSIKEETGVSAVYLSVDNGEWINMSYNNSEKKAYYELTTNAGDNGLHTIKIKLIDNLGNAQIYEYTAKVDNPTYTLFLFFIAVAVGIAVICIGVKASRKPVSKTPKMKGEKKA